MEVKLRLMQGASEIVHYDEPQVPLYIRRGRLSYFSNFRALCHWHDELELIYIESGEMFYTINTQRVLLKQGDCLMVNARQMHYGYGNSECVFICILVRSDLLVSNEHLYRTYVQPILANEAMPYFLMKAGSSMGSAAEWITKIWACKQKQEQGYELQVVAYLLQFWVELIRYNPQLELMTHSKDELSYLKAMIAYIHQYYGRRITLNELSMVGNVCRSRVCSLFKKYVQMSPMDFLNVYRLERSVDLLMNTTMSVTEIAMSCGFNHSSYYAKRFYQQYHCTPLTVRKK